METITLNGVELQIEGTYIEEEKGIYYDLDLSGSPDIPHDFEVRRVFVGDVNIIDLLSHSQLEEIVELVLDNY